MDDALRRIEEMIAEGADVIDIGGESTRPGYEHITVQEEIERVAPIIEMVAKRFDIPLSIDTYKPAVASEAVRKGASLVNDIWGFRGENLKTPESGMAQVVAQNGVSCCIMQNFVLGLDVKKKNYGTGGSFTGDEAFDIGRYDASDAEHDIDTKVGVASDIVIEGLKECIRLAEKAGIDRNKILLDPGIGFGKTYEDNIQVLKDLKSIKESFEYPMLLGASRKSVIGLTLNLSSDQRIEGTLATTARAVEAGCLFVRVHDIKENSRFIRMYEALR